MNSMKQPAEDFPPLEAMPAALCSQNIEMRATPLSPVTDEQYRLATSYIGDYWSDGVDETNFAAELGDPFVPDDDELDPDSWGDEILSLAGTPLRISLRIGDTMFEAMKVAYTNYWRKVDAQYHPGDPDGMNARYDRQWASVVNPGIGTNGPFSALASCQGGDEVDLIYMHPTHGIDKRVTPEEYCIRTSAYVAAFGIELYPGDLEAGLVHNSARL